MNELEFIFIGKKQVKRAEAVPDSQYRVLVNLIRSDRPRYWNFLCVSCGSKIAELQNMEVVSLDDFYDPQNLNNYAIGRHCKGYFPGTQLPCKYKYFFHLQ